MPNHDGQATAQDPVGGFGFRGRGRGGAPVDSVYGKGKGSGASGGGGDGRVLGLDNDDHCIIGFGGVSV